MAAPLDARARARVAIPFAIVTLIWGSTWLVIRDQIGTVAPPWSISYRFGFAALAMMGWALATRVDLSLTRAQHALVALIGLAQFCLNFQFVYRAEAHITSGLVAVVFALLIIPNAILGRLILGARLSRPFILGSLIATAGLALLFAREMRAVDARPGEVLLGLGLALAGVLCASMANVAQATARARAMPIIAMIAWALVYGVIFDVLFALILAGPPSAEWHWRYWLGAAWLGMVGSAFTFPLYFGMIRTIGPARAAYVNVLVPVIAMALSTLFEGYRWSLDAAAGAGLAAAGLVVALTARRD